MAQKVFISYSSVDYDIVNDIRNILLENNIDCWMAPESIPAGSDYAHEIPSAIESCKYFLLVLSDNSQRSIWVPKELDFAIDCKKIILPLKIDTVPLKSIFKFRLSNVQCIDMTQKPTDAMHALITFIKGNKNLSGENELYNLPHNTVDKECGEYKVLLNELFRDTVLYREALKSGIQEEFNNASSSMVCHLQNLYYFCERNKYNPQFQKLVTQANRIISVFNAFVPHFNAFANAPDRMDEEAQKSALMAEEIFNTFVDEIIRSLN